MGRIGRLGILCRIRLWIVPFAFEYKSYAEVVVSVPSPVQLPVRSLIFVPPSAIH